MPNRATVTWEAARWTCAVRRSNGRLRRHIPRALAGESVHVVRPSWLLIFASAWLPTASCSGHGRPLWLRACASDRNDRSIAAIACRPLREHSFACRAGARTRLSNWQRRQVSLPNVRHRRNRQRPPKVRQRAIVTRHRHARAVHRQASGGVRRRACGCDAVALECPGRYRGPVGVIRREGVPVACRSHRPQPPWPPPPPPPPPTPTPTPTPPTAAAAAAGSRDHVRSRRFGAAPVRRPPVPVREPCTLSNSLTRYYRTLESNSRSRNCRCYGTQILCKILCMGGTEPISGTRAAFALSILF
eukprot:COSAG02_NODE_2727_length_8152_cov_58.639017_3_plen_302_part_00